jgi:hypothetical protein
MSDQEITAMNGNARKSEDQHSLSFWTMDKQDEQFSSGSSSFVAESRDEKSVSDGEQRREKEGTLTNDSEVSFVCCGNEEITSCDFLINESNQSSPTSTKLFFN